MICVMCKSELGTQHRLSCPLLKSHYDIVKDVDCASQDEPDLTDYLLGRMIWKPKRRPKDTFQWNSPSVYCWSNKEKCMTTISHTITSNTSHPEHFNYDYSRGK